MAPLKKLKSVNKGIIIANDSTPSNKEEKSRNKKRKLAEMLGSQWSKHEIERFYDGYRKYGQDWKKVAGVVRSRSIGMVEALYNMNRAYLSLPEGTASVVGLIAMMTDHYNVLDGSGTERDSEGPEVMVRKVQKTSKPNSLIGSSRDYVKSQNGSRDGCLSLLKTCGDGIQLHFPVRKRTPRVLVAIIDNNPDTKTSEMHTNDERVLHGATLLSKEQKNPNSPQGLQMTHKNLERIKIAKEQEISPFQGLKIKNGGYAADEESKDDSLECNVARRETLPKESVDLGKSAIVGYKKRKKDECRTTSEGRRKRSKKLTHEDEVEACDALHALAEMSSMMPFLDAEHVDDDGESMVGRVAADRIVHSDDTLSGEKLSGDYRKKSMTVGKAETPDCSIKSAENESVADDEVKSGNSSGQIYAVSKRSYPSVIYPELSSSNDPHTGELEVAVSSAQDHTASQVVDIAKRKNKRKRDRSSLVKDKNNVPNGCLSDGLSVLQDKSLDVKGKLSHCLSSREVRRWCMYEWFYSAIDYPWFAKREFEEYLNHVGLGHIPRLTRSELGVIRSSLGRPRRFSENFLQVEREKLKHYRESVRSHYTHVRAGRRGLPPDLACPLYVGQEVIAIHPKTRECHNGSVLTVDHDNCRVQFHHPDLGVELVTDLDCMPLNPLENIPESMRKRPSNYQYIQHPKVNGAISSAFEERINNADHNLCVPPLSSSSANDMKVKPACPSLHTKALANGSLSTQLETQNHSRNMDQMRTQEAYVSPIQGLIGDSSRKVIDQHSNGPEYFPSLRLPVRDAVDINGNMHSSNNNSFCCEESTSNVAEIIEGSREKAQKMVDTAIKVMSSMKEDEDAFERIHEALDDNCRAQRATNGRPSTAMNSNTIRGSLPPQNLFASSNSIPQSASDVESDLEIPSDLITSCVATLLMIQTCTERQNPPAEVAQILDNAATSLRPCCPQNMSIYREIQMCMGRIKTQILALVPS